MYKEETFIIVYIREVWPTFGALCLIYKYILICI